MSANLKLHSFKSFDAGINKKLLKTDIEENELSSSLNMYYDGGKLKTRAGLNMHSEISVADENTSIYDIKLLGSVVYSEDKSTKFYLLTRQRGSWFYCKLMVLSSDATSSIIDLAKFNAIDYMWYVKAVNSVLITGKPIKGSGIFVLIGAVDAVDAICDKLIFELDSSLQSVQRVYTNEIYAPVVMANGRGSKYTDLPVSKRTFPKPSLLEDFNMLGGAFKVAFKTDGVSMYYYLPVKELSDNENENIEIKYTDATGSVYTWTIKSGEILSDYVKIGGELYGFSVNRTIGRIYSHNEKGEDLCLPMVDGVFNNLEVKAYKEPSSDRIFRMNVSQNFNSRVFLSGNINEGNTVCFSKKNNPLYFPESNISYFGDKTSIITAIEQQNDRLIVFKAHQIGICSSISSSNYSTDLSTMNRSSKSATLEKMDIKTINTGIGCKYPETVVNCANRLVFLGSDKKVYTITSTSNYLQRLYKLSDKIDSQIFAAQISENAFAINLNNNYMLFLDNKCFLFNYNTQAFLSATSPNGSVAKRNALAWYYFEYQTGQAQLFSAICLDDKAILFSKVYSGSLPTKIIAYTLENTKDYLLNADGSFTAVPINSSFTTKASSFNESRRKKITLLEIVFSNETTSKTPINLRFVNENKQTDTVSFTLNNTADEQMFVKRIPCVFGVRNFGFSLSCEDTISVVSANVRYKTC